ncbi:AbiV family abortive infection protein [Bradyrhizobium sp. 25ACV]
MAKAGATARALCLHQISLEECSKVENIGAWATSLLSGLPVDQNKVLASFRRHSAKNKGNAYMLKGSQAEKNAKARGDWKAINEPQVYEGSCERAASLGDDRFDALLYGLGAFAVPRHFWQRDGARGFARRRRDARHRLFRTRDGKLDRAGERQKITRREPFVLLAQL